MNARERFLAVMRFKQPDRVPLPGGFQWFWGETIERWHDEGLPEDVHLNEYFGFDRMEFVPVNLGLLPAFKYEVIEETDEYKITIDAGGVMKRELKDERARTERSMPQFMKFPITTREDWERMKERLNPKSPARYPLWWEDYKRCVKDRDYPLGIPAGSLYGGLRNLIGVEHFSVMFYEQPLFVHEMMEYMTDFIIETTGKALEEIDIDYATMWEDMAFKTQPLISPRMFGEFMVPRYRRITEFLRSHGVDIILLDSDGNINELVPGWLEGGVNGLYPLEVAASVDAVTLRKEYGKDLILSGNLDKRAFARGKEAIKEEVEKKVPWLLEQGGYLPSQDHGLPPDVPFENYMYYLDLVKGMLGG